MATHDDQSPPARVRERIRRWMEVTGLSQQDFAASVDKTQVWLKKVLGGENDVRLRYLDDLAFAMRTTAAELVRGHEDRYQLELTPTEVRIVEQLRRHPDTFTGVALLLRIPVPTHSIELTDAHRSPARAADPPAEPRRHPPTSRPDRTP